MLLSLKQNQNNICVHIYTVGKLKFPTRTKVRKCAHILTLSHFVTLSDTLTYSFETSTVDTCAQASATLSAW